MIVLRVNQRPEGASARDGRGRPPPGGWVLPNLLGKDGTPAQPDPTTLCGEATYLSIAQVTKWYKIIDTYRYDSLLTRADKVFATGGYFSFG